MEAKAKHTFEGNGTDELSFYKGCVLKVLNMKDKDWYKAEMDGKEGLVPSGYLEMKPHAWYVGRVPHTTVESMLHGEGAFAIVDSESTPGDFFLAVKFQNTVQKYKVLRDGAGKYFLWIVKFESLNELIDHHRKSSVDRSKQIFLRETDVVKATFDYTAQEEGELAFHKNDVMKVINKDDPGWWMAELNGQRGMIPSNYVQPLVNEQL